MLSNLRRMIPFFRLSSSALTLLIAFSTYFSDYGIEMPHGVRASMLATCASLLLLIGLMPVHRNANNVIPTILIRIGAPLLGILAGSHWFLAEVEPSSTLTFLAGPMIIGWLILLQYFFGLILALDVRETRRAKSGSEDLKDSLGDEYQRFVDEYADAGAPALQRQTAELERTIASILLIDLSPENSIS